MYEAKLYADLFPSVMEQLTGVIGTVVCLPIIDSLLGGLL